MSENVSSKNSSMHLTPPPNLALLLNQFNNTSPEQNVDPENVVNPRYFDIDALKLYDKRNFLSFFHINACSFNKSFDDLEYLLKWPCSISWPYPFLTMLTQKCFDQAFNLCELVSNCRAYSRK